MKKNLSLLIGFSLLSFATSGLPQNFYWDGGTANLSGTGTGISTGGTGTWNNTIENWDQGAGLPFSAWASGTNAFFGGTAGTVTLGASVTANAITITNKGYVFTDGGNTSLTLTVNTITNMTGGGLSTPTIITNNVVNSTTLNIWSSGSEVRFNAVNAGLTGVVAVNQGTVEFGDSATYNGGFSGGWSAVVASNATLGIGNTINNTVINNVISGAGEVEIENKSGVTTVLGGINGQNTYTGPTVIASGILEIESIDDVNPNAIGTGPLQVGNNASSATFIFLGSGPATTSRPFMLGGNGASILNGTGGPPITFNGPFSFGPNISVATKTLELTGAASGPCVMACNLTDYTPTNLLLVNKQSGTWMLAGSNYFSGGVTFTGSASGALLISNDTALGIPTGGIFLTNGSGTISSTNASVTIGASRTITVTTNVIFSPTDTNNLMVAAFITGNGYVSKGFSSYTLGAVRFSNDTNNFTGNFSMSYGQTEFTSVADAGIPCSLGTGGYITNVNSTSFAILRYVGASNSTTHRPLIWTATTGPLALDNTNTGTIAYMSTSNLVTGSGVKTLTLQGSNTGTNTLNQVVNDSGGATSLIKTGTGEWLLTAANTYSGTSTIDEGTLLINGSISIGAVTVNGGTLAGSGTIGGAVTVNAAGTLAAGNPSAATVGTLTINNAVTNLGTISMRLNATSVTSDKLTGITTLVYGGTLSLTNLSGTLTTNDTFPIFTASSYQGGFTSITPATPGPGLLWNTNSLLVNGTLGIATAPATPVPVITSFSLSGTNLTLLGTNGVAGGPFVVLSSTNVALPLTQWMPILTNDFDGSGNFNVTADVDTNAAQEYFIISE